MTTLHEPAEALARGDAAACLRALAPHRARLATDDEVALLWLQALAREPSSPSLDEALREVLEPRADVSPELVIAACAALNAAAARRPMDAPPRTDGPAARAEVLASAALAALGALEGEPAPGLERELLGYLWINRANALRALGPTRDEEARESYARALELVPAKGAWWHDLGVLHKWRGRWQEAFDAFLRARARLGDQRGILWNAAIAATALGEGDVAAGLWRDLGLPVRLSEHGMPVVEGVPAIQIRVPSVDAGYGVERGPKEGFEVLSVTPLSPAHGVISSPSFRDAPVDYGDLVLWDGAPVATDPPVFPLLEILRPGDERRLRFVALVREGDVESLTLPAGARVFAHPSGREVDGERLVYGKLVARADVALDALREAIEASTRTRRGFRVAMPALYELLGPAKRAGQEHQAWRAIERAAIKRGLVEEVASGG